MKNNDKKSEVTIEAIGAEFRRSVGVITEDLEHKVDLVLEQYTGLTGKVDTLTGKVDGLTKKVSDIVNKLDDHTATLNDHTAVLHDHTEMIGKLLVDVDIIKDHVGLAKARAA